MSELADAVTRAARSARLHELAADWNPELAPRLIGRIPGELVAEAISGLDNPAAMFAAVAPHVPVEALVRAARSVGRPRARVNALGAILGVAPECWPEVLALARQFHGNERVYSLAEAFPHLSAEQQAAVLLEAGFGLPGTGYAAKRIARAIRPDAFRTAWDVFTRSIPNDVTSASILTGVAPADERAALRSTLTVRVSAGDDLAYSAIRELLPHATGSDRLALVDRALKFAGHYAAANIAQALGDAIREPAIEASYVAFLDAGKRDYPWDLAVAYADVAARRSPLRAHCLERATALLDRMLDPSAAGANPYPVAQGDRITAALEHQVNALLAVTNALEGEPRLHRERQVLEWLARVCPEHSRDDLVPIAWGRTTKLDPALHATLLGIVATIQEDAAAFDALAQIMAAAPQLEGAALDIVMSRIENHAFPSLTFSPPAPPASIALVPAVLARRVATPEEIQQALSARVISWRIVEVEKLAREASADALPEIDDPFVALVANILLLDAPAEGAIAQLDALFAQGRKRWEAYCRAASALAPRLVARERVAAIKTIFGLVVDIYPLCDVSPLVVGLDVDAWPAVAALIPGIADSALPAGLLAAALTNVPAVHAETLVRAVLSAAPRVPMVELCEAIRAHGFIEHVRSDLAGFLVRHVWSSMSTLVGALESLTALLPADERTAIAGALESRAM